MTIDSYLLFVVASVLLCIAPGPDMIFLLGRTIAQGRKAGIIAAVGINLGAYVHLLGAVAGISALLATSAYAFTIIKWMGAIYLLYIGARILLSKQNQVLIDGNANSNRNYRQIFWQGFLSDVLNPKVAIFYLAFLPQFIKPNTAHQSLQIFFLGVTVNVIAIIINIVLVYSASLLTNSFRKHSAISGWLNKMLGALFIFLGLKLASEKI
jgi:threonine/homoserine/homoserine lactone efflux protein